MALVYKQSRRVSGKRKSALLSFAQQQLFYLYLLEPSSPAYNVLLTVRLRGPLDVPALMECLQTIVQRHEILRTTITLTNGLPAQLVAPTSTLTPQIIDASTFSQVEQTYEVDRVIAAKSSTPFNLLQGPLIRVTLLHLNTREHVFLLNMHHIISDGWSIGILMRELTLLYTARIQGLPNPLGTLPIQYADYATWQRQLLQGAVLDEQLAYWRRHLANVPTFLELPTDHPRPDVQHYQSEVAPLCSQKRCTWLCVNSAGRRRYSVHDIADAFQIVLSRYSRQTDFLLGAPVANRTRRRQGLSTALTIHWCSAAIWQAILRSVHWYTYTRRVPGSVHTARLPFELLVEALQPECNASYNPLFQVMFVLQNASDSSLELPGLQVQYLEEQGESAKFDLTLSITEGENTFDCILEYDSDLFEHSTMVRLQEHFLTLLQGSMLAPERSIADLPMLTPQEEHYLLHEVHAPITHSAPTLCLHQLVEEQVERTPEAVALTYGEEFLSYRELNRQANLLAARLRSLGVGPEVLVGLCVQRSLSMVVGLLGILKAGGAYVPLDPTYPEGASGVYSRRYPGTCSGNATSRS